MISITKALELICGDWYDYVDHEHRDGYALPAYAMCWRTTFCRLSLVNNDTITGTSVCLYPTDYNEASERRKACVRAIVKLLNDHSLDL